MNDFDRIKSLFSNDYSCELPRTKYTHPYNYNPITQYDTGKKANNTVYTDRLNQWDFEKSRKLREKHFGDIGDYWDTRSPEDIESFLRDYTNNNDLELIRVIEYCNQATGFPVWRLDYNDQ